MPRGDDEEAVRRQHRAGDHPQAIAERAAGRQAQELGRHQRTVDAEQAGDLVRRIEAGAVVLDEVAAFDLADPDAASRCRARCRRVPSAPAGAACSLGHASLLLQALDGAEGGPVGALEFQIRRLRWAW